MQQVQRQALLQPQSPLASLPGYPPKATLTPPTAPAPVMVLAASARMSAADREVDMDLTLPFFTKAKMPPAAGEQAGR